MPSHYIAEPGYFQEKFSKMFPFTVMQYWQHRNEYLCRMSL